MTEGADNCAIHKILRMSICMQFKVYMHIHIYVVLFASSMFHASCTLIILFTALLQRKILSIIICINAFKLFPTDVL